jgi:glycosyltransferase involved in cell wall biosynthesis
MAADIAVLMAAYNADDTVNEAVDSIFASTVPCDLFLVDDGSRRPLSEQVKPRPGLEIIRLARNGGLSAALNLGLGRILSQKYKYVARMDADDISCANRFAVQIAFMEKHPEVGLLGSGVRFIDDTLGAMVMDFVPPTDPAEIRKALFFNNCFMHPTWLVRREVLVSSGPYSLDYPAAEDYEFLRRICGHIVLANIPDLLVVRRISSNGITVSKRRRQLIDRLKIQMKYRDLLAWSCWAGMAQTIMLLLIPGKLLTAAKAKWQSGTRTTAQDALHFAIKTPPPPQ